MSEQLAALKEAFSQKNRIVQERVGARNALQAKLEQHVATVELLSERMANTEKAVHLIQMYSQDQQAMLSARVEEIVTAGIRAVFQDPGLVFRLHYSETKSGSTKKAPEVTMTVLYSYDGVEQVGNLRDSFGGGLAVVTAALLNVVVVLLMTPRVAPVVLWDEPLRDLSPPTPEASEVSRGYRTRMADFLRSLVDQTDLQILLVTHEPQYAGVADYSHHFDGGIGVAPAVKTTRPIEGDE